MANMDDKLRMLMGDIKVAVEAYLKTQPKDVRLYVNVHRECASEGDRSVIVMCPECKRLNRLIHGIDGAICAECRSPLPRLVPVEPAKAN